ncbi:uncharacterized protein BO66DRAFT_402065 [Aspergillus aculeatinus CBS 121060]|uniref:Uncharacterized protein n=1 Tax=Aspergillus aculeatinus CBS 121060 TaxID=1448322 RepID=A0ACD1H7H8_9EURO|nr:hypothetical protein BO66DRAFT_402065 [Aspergillus aculeatinus CBS 121060]RAH69401.1 hypothetical protein BO66DRAFT_402065 [Aspergillus aculeatinus CBS 121060]
MITYPNWGFFVYYAPFSKKSPPFANQLIDQLKTYIHCEINDCHESVRSLPQSICESLGLDVIELLPPRAAPHSIDEIRRLCRDRLLLSRNRPPLVPGILTEMFVKAIDLLYDPRDGAPESLYYQGWFKVGVDYIQDFYHQMCQKTDDYEFNMERICPILDGPGRNHTYCGDDLPKHVATEPGGGTQRGRGWKTDDGGVSAWGSHQI